MLSNRVTNLKPSPTLSLFTKVKELREKGHDVLSLTVGEPDWDTFEPIKEAGIKAIQGGHTKYTPSNGLPELREVICQQTILDLGCHYTPEQVTVSVGGKFILYSALQSLVNPGDEVVIPAPYWVSYPSMVELAGGKPVIVRCGSGAGFKMTPEALDKAITTKTKVVILNSPSNPSGAVYSLDELKAITEVLKNHTHVVILSDDIYNRLVFEGDLAPHILQAEPSLHERTIVINGVSKTYSMTGWRLGWALGPLPVIKAMTNLQSQSVSCASPFTQMASIEAINSGKEFLAPYLKKLSLRKKLVMDRLNSFSELQVQEPKGAFYAFPDIRKLCGRGFKGHALEDCGELAKYLLQEELVAVVPGKAFGEPGFFRMSFALDDARLGKALTRIETFICRLD